VSNQTTGLPGGKFPRVTKKRNQGAAQGNQAPAAGALKFMKSDHEFNFG